MERKNEIVRMRNSYEKEFLKWNRESKEVESRHRNRRVENEMDYECEKTFFFIDVDGLYGFFSPSPRVQVQTFYFYLQPSWQVNAAATATGCFTINRS